MITLALLLVITLFVMFIAVTMISIGGTLFIIFGGDLIIAIFVIWFIFFRNRNKNKKEK